ncbi:MarR family transcriptional regulator [Haliea sp. E1-2-M8]|uniref:MarR family winged helix-turn-helix transcriptional regulator n=1 Tax=Haliea sp. E1-2-M8 TaxID=3064706 RepID=UPI002724506D|nr:MarR family transcriptional regulator [Haliea sp. E1-2-M8]MDO8860618.1 MarR family transcriptional regulator [Haliea sp. E1-2-M8]
MQPALSLTRFLPYRCNTLARKISVSLSRIYTERFGISIAEWRVLVTLAEYGELQAKQIGELTSMDKVRVSRAVAGLQGCSLLQRRPCARDSRAALLSLSAAGADLYRRIEPEALAWEQSLLAPLAPAERDTLFALIDKLELQLAGMPEKPALSDRNTP